MPRNVAGRTESVPSLIVELEKLNEGIRAWMARPSPLCPNQFFSTHHVDRNRRVSNAALTKPAACHNDFTQFDHLLARDVKETSMSSNATVPCIQ